MSEKNNKLYFGNLEYSVTSRELQEFLNSRWEVLDCKVIDNKGFGFVTFATEEVAKAAQETLNDTELKGRKLKIDFAKETKPKSFSGGGGFNRDRGGRSGGRPSRDGGRDRR